MEPTWAEFTHVGAKGTRPNWLWTCSDFRFVVVFKTLNVRQQLWESKFKRRKEYLGWRYNQLARVAASSWQAWSQSRRSKEWREMGIWEVDESLRGWTGGTFGERNARPQGLSLGRQRACKSLEMNNSSRSKGNQEQEERIKRDFLLFFSKWK